MANLNPLNITGPAKAPNHIQPDYRIPVVHPFVAAYAIGTNVLNLTWPIPLFRQPGT